VDDYRLEILIRVNKLDRLDKEPVSEEERDEAEQLKLDRESAKKEAEEEAARLAAQAAELKESAEDEAEVEETKPAEEVGFFFFLFFFFLFCGDSLFYFALFASQSPRTVKKHAHRDPSHHSLFPSHTPFAFQPFISPLTFFFFFFFFWPIRVRIQKRHFTYLESLSIYFPQPPSIPLCSTLVGGGKPRNEVVVAVDGRVLWRPLGGDARVDGLDGGFKVGVAEEGDAVPGRVGACVGYDAVLGALFFFFFAHKK
jgi:hypothetical protein